MNDQASLFGETLAEARARVTRGIEEGLECPCCGQLCKLYRRKISKGAAQFLVWLTRNYLQKQGWYDRLDAPVWMQAVSGGEYALTHYWDLMEQQPNETNPKLPRSRSGIWRPTHRGIRFAMNESVVPKYALVFNAQVRGFDGPLVSITECLPEYFDFWESWGY